MKAQRIKVGRTHARNNAHYDVLLGSSLARDIDETLAELGPSSLIVVTDTNLVTHARTRITKLLRYRGRNKSQSKNLLCTIKAGEASKSLRSLNHLYNQALGASPDRDTLVVALGGGVVGDIAGMLASTLLRGVRILHLPTSLLAMVDSAVGGKSAVNHIHGKNLIGTFHHPARVIVDLDMLATLPDTEYQNALGEVVKYGAGLDRTLFQLLENKASDLLAREPNTLFKVVKACIANKARIVSKDPHEQSGRIALNLGHTIGHAFEKLSKYRLRHGRAVAFGLEIESKLGVHAGQTALETLERIQDVLACLGFKTRLPKSATLSALLQAMANDKKRTQGKLRFVLPTVIGAWTTWAPDNAKHLRTLLGKAIG